MQKQNIRDIKILNNGPRIIYLQVKKKKKPLVFQSFTLNVSVQIYLLIRIKNQDFLKQDNVPQISSKPQSRNVGTVKIKKKYTIISR